jgi:hypothetical protein
MSPGSFTLRSMQLKGVAALRFGVSLKSASMAEAPKRLTGRPRLACPYAVESIQLGYTAYLRRYISDAIFQATYSYLGVSDSLAGDDDFRPSAHFSSSILCIEGGGSMDASIAPCYAIAS